MKKTLLVIASLLLVSGAVISATAESDDHKSDGKGHKGKSFERADTNGDGTISKDEYLAEASSRFAKIDADANGSVSPDEMSKYYKEKREKFKEMRKKHKEKRGQNKSDDHDKSDDHSHSDDASDSDDEAAE